jgi:HEAT repeat protein
LVKAAGHEAVAVRRAATFGLLKLGTDASSAEPLLRRLAEDPHKGVKTYAEKALAKLEGSS